MRRVLLMLLLASSPLKAVDQAAAYQRGQAMAGTYKAQAPTHVLNEDIPNFKGKNVPESSYSHEQLGDAARYKRNNGKEGSASEILNTTNKERAYFPIKANDPLLRQANEVVANPETFVGAELKEEEGEEQLVKSRHWCRTSPSMTVKVEEELVVKPVILKEVAETGHYIDGWEGDFFGWWADGRRPGPHSIVTRSYYHHFWRDECNLHWKRSRHYSNYRLRKGVLDSQTGEVQASNWEYVTKEAYDKAEEATGHEGWRSLNPSAEELVARRSCRVVSHDCLEGPQKKTVDGVLVFKPCWKRRTVYECGGDHQNDCEYLQKRGCAQINSRCVEKAEKGHCLVYENLYECEDKHRVRRGVTLTGDVPYCLDGSCATTGYTANQDLAEVLSKLAIFRDIQNEFKGAVTIFPGEKKYCDKDILQFSDCCQRMGGWGQSIKLTECNKDEIEFVKRREKGQCVYVGTYCAEKMPIVGTCIRKRSHSCCYGGKLARLVQEQGRRQLGINFGTGEKPNCRPLTVQELARLDFSKLDLREIFADLTSKVSPPDPQKVLTQFRQDWQNRLPTSDQDTKPDLMDTVESRKESLSDKPGQYTLNHQDSHPNPKSEIAATKESRVVF